MVMNRAIFDFIAFLKFVEKTSEYIQKLFFFKACPSNSVLTLLNKSLSSTI